MIRQPFSMTCSPFGSLWCFENESLRWSCFQTCSMFLLDPLSHKALKSDIFNYWYCCCRLAKLHHELRSERSPGIFIYFFRKTRRRLHCYDCAAMEEHKRGVKLATGWKQIFKKKRRGYRIRIVCHQSSNSRYTSTKTQQ